MREIDKQRLESNDNNQKSIRKSFSDIDLLARKRAEEKGIMLPVESRDITDKNLLKSIEEALRKRGMITEKPDSGSGSGKFKDQLEAILDEPVESFLQRITKGSPGKRETLTSVDNEAADKEWIDLGGPEYHTDGERWIVIDHSDSQKFTEREYSLHSLTHELDGRYKDLEDEKIEGRIEKDIAGFEEELDRRLKCSEEWIKKVDNRKGQRWNTRLGKLVVEQNKWLEDARMQQKKIKQTEGKQRKEAIEELAWGLQEIERRDRDIAFNVEEYWHNEIYWHDQTILETYDKIMENKDNENLPGRLSPAVLTGCRDLVDLWGKARLVAYRYAFSEEVDSVANRGEAKKLAWEFREYLSSARRQQENPSGE